MSGYRGLLTLGSSSLLAWRASTEAAYERARDESAAMDEADAAAAYAEYEATQMERGPEGHDDED